MAYPIVILGSGRGSNADALLKAESKKQLGAAKIAAIISDHEDAGILALGQKHKVPAIYIDPQRKGARLSDEAEQAYIERIQSFSPKLIVLAGFMRIITAKFIEAFDGKVINLHPSLLPSFIGMNGIKQAYDHGVKVTGCTVHWVTADLDSGPIIDQKEVRIEESDTLEILETKIHIAEHRLLPEVIANLSKGKIKEPS
ncbi:MAG: phosphoribosylglycinamide formyltransferase [Opitutales bacterium]|nr:phosphoribosylglycinamide formyltransferase [Opitutales bacterium]MDP4883820.1 phosphoribosylglycinamide formyltransferase [Opitutales bacterium]